MDSQSTMDLICDPALVESTFKSSHSMRLKSNGGTMKVKKQAIMPGYHAHVWYNKKAITNILSLSKVIKQYHVTYDSNDQMFVVHHELEGKLDMEFWMHESGLHYFDPRDSELILLILSPRIRQASQRGRSRKRRSHDPCTPSSIIHPGRTSNGSSGATRSRTVQ